MKKIKVFRSIFLCTILCTILSVQAKENTKSPNNIVTSVLKNGILLSAGLYSVSFLHTLFHEFGHAIFAKILNGSKIDIHIGKSLTLENVLDLYKALKSDPKRLHDLGKTEKFVDTAIREIEKLQKKENAYLFKMGGVYIHSLNHFQGAYSQLSNNINNRLENFLVAVGGGIGGVVFMCLLFGSLAYYYQHQSGKKTSIFSPFKNISLNKNMDIMSRSRNLLFTAISLCIGTMGIFYSFIPSNKTTHKFLPFGKLQKTNDGNIAWRTLGISDKTQKAAGVASWAATLITTILILKKVYSESMAPILHAKKI